MNFSGIVSSFERVRHKDKLLLDTFKNKLLETLLYLQIPLIAEVQQQCLLHDLRLVNSYYLFMYKANRHLGQPNNTAASLCK